MHHGEGLRRLLITGPSARSGEDADRLVRQLAEDHREADLEPADAAMLDYVERLTSAPGDMGAADVRTLRDAGFDDRGIHDICSIAAYYAFVNRIADGLGVELEPGRGV